MCVLSQLDCYWQWIAVCLQSAAQSDFNLSRFLYFFFWLPKCLKPPKKLFKRTILCKVTVLVWTAGDSHWTCLLSVCCSDCSFSALLLEPKAAYTWCHSLQISCVPSSLSAYVTDSVYLHHSQSVSLLIVIQYKNCSLFFLLSRKTNKW